MMHKYNLFYALFVTKETTKKEIAKREIVRRKYVSLI